MIFHYNPLMHWIEINSGREMVFTITRLNILSPRIRYNIHDEGGIMSFPEMVEKCKNAGLDLAKMFGEEFDSLPKLPFMWIYGRKDSTISVMGANIYPEDLEAALYANAELAKLVSSFSMSLWEEGSEVRPKFDFEISRLGDLQESAAENLKQAFASKILEHLKALNKDFAEAWHEHPHTLMPVIGLYATGQGPFSGNAGRIKQVRITAS